MRTVYADSADFLSKHVEAARAHDREKSSYKDFKTYYEEADVLLIDDVQYLQGKTQTLDIVFQLFNTRAPCCGFWGWWRRVMVDHGRFIIGGHIRLGGCRQRSGAHRGRGWE